MIDQIVQNIHNNNCMPFIGAGASVWDSYLYPNNLKEAIDLLDHTAAGTAERAINSAVDVAFRRYEEFFSYQMIPTDDIRSLDGAPPTDFLVLSMFALLNKREREKFLSDERYPKLSTISQILYSSKPDSLARLLHNLYSDCKPNLVHQLLARFPIGLIITTNYDDCIEKARREIGKPVNPRCDDTELLNNGFIFPLLFKIHGSTEKKDSQHQFHVENAREYLNKVILTDQQYWEFPKGWTIMTDFVRCFAATKQILFIGYGLRDFNIIEQFHRIAPLKGKTFKPVVIVKKLSTNQQLLWKERGFELIEGDQIEFLNSLTQKYFGLKNLSGLESPCKENYSDSKDVCIQILMQLIRVDSENGKFRKCLIKAVENRFFNQELFAHCRVWGNGTDGQSRFKTFLNMKWLRGIVIDPTEASTDQYKFYEFPVDIRQKVLDRLNL